MPTSSLSGANHIGGREERPSSRAELRDEAGEQWGGAVKRYMLFAGERFYPSGGWDDFLGAFDSTEGARAHVAALKPRLHIEDGDWFQIVDTEAMEVVDKGGPWA